MADAPLLSGVLAAPKQLVQCGWCPVIIGQVDDFEARYLHFQTVHGYDGGYSVRHIKGSDWDMAELLGSDDDRPAHG